MKKIAADRNYNIIKESRRKRMLVDHTQLQKALADLKEEMRLEMQKMLLQQKQKQ